VGLGTTPASIPDPAAATVDAINSGNLGGTIHPAGTGSVMVSSHEGKPPVRIAATSETSWVSAEVSGEAAAGEAEAVSPRVVSNTSPDFSVPISAELGCESDAAPPVLSRSPSPLNDSVFLKRDRRKSRLRLGTQTCGRDDGRDADDATRKPLGPMTG